VITTAAAYLPVLAFAAFAVRRLMSYLHIFQQEEYDATRFLPWLLRTRSLDRKLSAALVVLGVVEFAGVRSDWRAAGPWFGLALAVAFLLFCAVEKDPRRSAKKKLVLTARAKRILGVAIALSLVLAVLVALAHPPVWVWLLPVHLLPLLLVAANLLLAPFEQHIQNKFWHEAHDKLLRLKPTIVGITGSFGKTSVKHMLGHVLDMQAPTLVTPGSVNTPMGISRIVREQLDDHHRFFIGEMGAYGIGSIARLCRLVPPDVAIITAVGHAHYERFKSLDAVARAKFELAEAVAANGGKIVIAEQVLDFAPARAFFASHRAEITTVGTSPQADLRVTAIRQTAAGTETDVSWRGKPYTLKAPLYGEHHGMNLALTFAAAAVMGVAPADIVLSLASTPQIKHRLEVKREPNGSVLVDDAYNSNPVGFASGLAALDILRSGNGRRILVTPGMVELGAAHEEEHRKIGTLAGTHVDVLLPVLPERISSMVTAYTAANPRGLVIECESFAHAQDWLNANLQTGDVVLLENDLPDLYETKLNL
jgi:UDP-N-acetylmuramoyl-tripeptide--D-alanyl-D-alanine ligase